MNGGGNAVEQGASHETELHTQQKRNLHQTLGRVVRVTQQVTVKFPQFNTCLP